MSTRSSHDVPKPAPRPRPGSASRPHSRSSSQNFTTPRSLSSGHFKDLGSSVSQSLGGSEPPAKRQRLDSSRSNTKDGNREISNDAGASSVEVKREVKVLPGAMVSSPTSISIPPFPPRPAPKPVKREQSESELTPTIKREEVSLKPYTLEPPKSAPQFYGGKTADFGPWTGRSPEDMLTESAIKHGYSDKTQIAQNETGSARPMIWASVKHKSGLSILSSLFAAALEQRRAAGAVVAKSTFKPPPRVTLTDAKRESWLRDLADASIPLRRLSRSIPHGIRGKPLLDHCLSKRIPTWRAVWLAKCVGANEIRAFKRKGTTGAFATGGESKWVRDWTACVQQFIESVVDAGGAEDWKQKVTYALQLVGHVYSDQLLDQEFFLEWLINRIHTSAIHTLPTWLLITKLFWKDIVKYRRRGRCLAVALSEQLLKLHNTAILAKRPEFWQRLVGLVRSFLVAHPSCFLMPNHWLKYEKVLRLCDDPENVILTDRFDRIARRNQQLERPDLSRPEENITPRRRVIRILDSARSNYEFQDLSQQCLDATSNRDTAVGTLLQWATTPFRTGQWRLYLAVRLLRKWSRMGIDLDRPIMSLLAKRSTLASLHPSSLHMLLAELVRSHHFSLGKYLQWMMARGAFPAQGDGSHFEIGLLHSVPLHGLPEHVLNLRQIVLSAMEGPARPTIDIEAAKAFCASKLSFLSAQRAVVPSESALSRSDHSQKLEISRWIRQSLATHVSVNSEAMDCDGETVSKLVVLSLRDFQATCALYKHLDDLPILADIHRLFIDNCNITLLGEIADSINIHFACFYAFGAANDLFGRLLERLEDMTGRSNIERPVFAALVELAQRFPGLDKTVARLRQELAACEPSSAIAVCSPVSDQMVEGLQNADSSFLEEVEMRLNNGTSMDQPVLSRVFLDVMKRLELAWHEHGLMISYVEILAKLRAINPDDFDHLMGQWMKGLLNSAQRPALATVVTPMVCAGVVTIKDVCGAWTATSNRSLAIDLLRLVTDRPAPPSFSGLRMYRFEQSCQDLVLKEPEILVGLVKTVVDSCSCGDPKLKKSASELVTSTRFRDLLVDCFTGGYAKKISPLEQAFIGNAAGAPLETIDRVLGLSLSQNAQQVLKALLKTANDFNFRLCQLRLSYLTRTCDVQQNKGRFAPTLVHEMASIIGESDGTWRLPVSQLPTGLCLEALRYSSTTLLQRLEHPSEAAGSDVTHDERTARLTEIITVLEQRVPAEECLGILESICSAIQQIQTRLHSTPISTSPTTSSPIPPSTNSVILSKETKQHLLQQAAALPTLLTLLSIFRRLFRLEKTSQSTLTRLALTLSLLMTSTRPNLPADLSSQVFDTLLLLSDHLSQETRQHAAQLIRDQYKLNDARLAWALGYDSEPDRLVLAVPESALQAQQAAAQNNNQAGTPRQGSFAVEANVKQGITLPADLPRFGTASNMAAVNEKGRGKEKESKSGASGSAADEKIRFLPFHLRQWELVQDATPVVGENDASLSLTLFGARRAVL